MLYLFNSAYRALYLRNVLNTVYLPVGGVNEYRYRLGTNVAKDEVSGAVPGEDVAIVFADRFGNGAYQYLPLRKGRLLATGENDGYLFFTVELGDFVFPRDPTSFDRLFKEKLADRPIPRLTAENPWERNDGHYAVIEGDVFADRQGYLSDDLAWSACVEAIGQCKAFETVEPQDPKSTDGTSPERDFIFVRARLQDSKGRVLGSSKDGQRSLRRRDDRRPVFNLIRGQRTDLELTYRYPAQRRSRSARATIECHAGGCVTTLGNSIINVEAERNTVRQSFATVKYSDESRDAIWLEFVAEGGKVAVGPDARIQLRIVQARWFGLRVFAGVFLFALAGLLASGDVGKVFAIVPIDTGWSYTAQRISGLILQAGSVVWLAQLLGKKLL